MGRLNTTPNAGNGAARMALVMARHCITEPTTIPEVNKTVQAIDAALATLTS